MKKQPCFSQCVDLTFLLTCCSCHQLFDLRRKVVGSDAMIYKLQFQISQLEGSEVSGRTREQSKRLEKIQSLDNDHVRACLLLWLVTLVCEHEGGSQVQKKLTTPLTCG